MDDSDPYLRTLSSPVSAIEPAAGETPGALLKNARWHAGLSQADVAQRAQTSQQAVARYEKGLNAPSVELLRRLLAACGMRLDLTVSPEPGLVDAPIRELLERPPLARLPEEFVQLLSTLVPVLSDLDAPAVASDKIAARLRGAPVRAQVLEFWVDEHAVDAARLEQALEAAGVSVWSVSALPGFPPATPPRFAFLDGELQRKEVRVRGMRQFAGHLARASKVDAPFGQLLVTSASDTVLTWSPRDRDRLALQRAHALNQEMTGPPRL